MTIDSLSISILAKELKNTLCGGKISKIFQPEKDEIVLHVYAQRNYKLVLSANASLNRIHISAETKENPKNAQNFCMLLRKHLTNAVICGITQMPWERVVDISLQARNDLGYTEQKHLIFELTGKTANIILCNDNYVIFDTLKHLPLSTESQRIIIAGARYTFFEKRDLLTLEQKMKIAELVTNSSESVDKLMRENVMGISSQTVAEILFGIDKENHSTLNALRITGAIESFLEKLQNPKPNVVIQNDSLFDVFPCDFQSVKGQKLFFDTLNEAHDYFFAEKDKQLRFGQKAKAVATSLKNTISRLEKKIALQTQELKAAEENSVNKIYGDLILANVHVINRLVDKVSVVNYYEPDCPIVTIPLDPSKTAQQNAQEYYKRYHKQKNTISYTTSLLQENKELLEYALTIKLSLQNCDTTNELSEVYQEMTDAGFIKGKRKNVEKSLPSKPLEYSIDGYKVLVGKNNIQNDIVTHKLSKPDDIWLHTQNMHSAHVLIVSQNEKIPEVVILKAAQITAHYSQAKLGGKTAVDFCLKKYVRKPPKTKPGFVIYTNFSTLIVEGNQHPELQC